MGVGTLICVGCAFFARCRIPWWFFYVSVEKGVKIWHSGVTVAGEVLAAYPGLVVETGPGGVGRHWK